MPLDWTGFLAPLVIYGLVFALHIAVPAERVEGYAIDRNTGRPLWYRLNGLPVTMAILTIWVAACRTRLIAWDYLYTVRWESAIGACAIGIVYSLWAVFRAPSTGKSLLAELFLGREDNPQYFGGRVDAKMVLYLVGAAMLVLNVVSFTAHHVLRHPHDISPGLVLHAVMFGWFVFDYLVFERVHLYTYDLFAERVGFKLGWGCLTFYPFFYAIGLWALAPEPNPGTPTPLLIGFGAVFWLGWCLARGANMQKYTFKRDPNAVFLGFIAPRTVSDGSRRLLCSGFWGVSRHINYLGEILMGLGLALSLGYPSSPWPWLYPLYYVLLLVPRERDDDRRCAAKYGSLWDEYRKKVRWRIIPGLY